MAHEYFALVECHCKLVKGTVLVNSRHPELIVCQCIECRYSSGQLCTTYLPISTPAKDLMAGCKGYNHTSDGTEKCFCANCGCHIFRSMENPESNTNDALDSIWEVSTGVLDKIDPSLHLRAFVRTGETRDGGLSIWLDEHLSSGNANLASYYGPSPYLDFETSSHYTEDRPNHLFSVDSGANSNLQAKCLCGTVHFHITRPDASSFLPHSPFPDLMIPYHSQSPLIPNLRDEKWWLRPNNKYLAGACACRSCRLTSGFEIQCWTFVPRTNIVFDLPSEFSPGSTEANALPLDFNDPRIKDVLRSYNSSPGVVREFCGTCGATVFWHDAERPDLIDVSIGLLRSPIGARAEDWLDWWTDRVSFSEDGIRGRKSLGIIQGLEKGFKEMGEARKTIDDGGGKE
jgi:hypothetical protein